MLLSDYKNITFVNWTQFHSDIREWEQSLPYFDAVCGIPTSGVYPAAYIAMQRNIYLLNLSQLLINPQQHCEQAKDLKDKWLNKQDFRYRDHKPLKCHRVLIVDDSSTAQSNTIQSLKAQMPSSELEISYGAVYRECDNAILDYSYKLIPQVRIFEWNWLKHWIISRGIFDMDGVICEDWVGDEVVEHDNYIKHIQFCKPLYRPYDKIKAIVTSRLEKYRDITVAWLKSNDIQFDHLYMHPAESPLKRRKANDYAQRKAHIYARDVSASIFIESDQHQAITIASITRKPVLCIKTMEIY